jgi:pimeloyl-ACP methyl ester carboxylesterase
MQRTPVTLANGLDLSCLDHGEHSEFAVVMLPGPTDSWLSYRAVLERMPSDLRCIAVSQRGHGDSSKPDLGYRIEDFAGDVPQLLDALGIERAVLVGHSGSCLTTRRVALDHPDRVAGLVLEAAPTTLKNNAALQAVVDSVVAPLEDPIAAGFAHSWVLDTSADSLDATLADELVAEVLKVPARVWREMFASLMSYDDTPDIHRITPPTLLIWGDADELIGREMQDELLRSLPDASLIVYHGVGHTPRWENPDRFSSDVVTFAEALQGRYT